MAQVKKFNIGGSVQKMKYGNIIKNGTTYEMTEESMKRLEQYIAAADPDIQQSLANDWKLLMSGQDITIDTMANRRSTVPEDFTKGQLRRLGKDKATESRWHGAVNSDIHKYNLATQYLGKFDPSVITEKAPEKIKFSTPDSNSFSYHTDESGNKEYKTIVNNDEYRYFSEWRKYLKEKDKRGTYDVSKYGNIKDIEEWYDALPDPDAFMNTLDTKIKSGNELSYEEKDFLTAIGLKGEISAEKNPKYEEKVKSDETQAAKQKAWRAFNVGNVWNDSEMDNDYFVYNPTTGTFTVKTPTLDGSIGFHFNDDFVANNYGYDHLKGRVKFNGVWYNEKDLYNPESKLYRMLTHKQYDYRNKNLRGDFDAANQVLKTNWSGVTYIPASSDYLGPFYGQNSSYIYQDTNWLTNNSKYGALDLGGKDWNLLKAINMNGSANDLGVRDWRYILTDAYGRYIDPYGNVVETPYEFDNSKFSNLYAGQTDPSKQTVNHYSRLVDDSTSPYYNRYADEPIYMSDKKTPLMESWLGLDGNTKNAFVYFHPNVGGIEDTTFENMPMDVYNVLHSKDFWDNYNNPQTSRNAKRRFATLIEKGKNKMTEEDWTALRINNGNIINSIINYFTINRRTGKKYTSSIQSNKSGGVIKYQTPSGPIGERKVDDKVVALAEQMNSPYEPAKLKDEFTPEDWLDISAVATDLIGFGVGYVPGWGDLGNLILSGAGATTLGAIADRKRVKHGALPKGTAFRNAAANIGADIVSLVPIVGDAANFTNSLKRATRIAPIILSSAGAMATLQNYPDIVKSFETLATNPSEFTTADLRNISIGLQFVTGMTTRATRAYKDSNLAAKSATPKEQRYGFERTDADGKKVLQNLDDADIKALTEAKGQKNINAVIDQIATKYNLSDSEKSALKLAGPTGMGFKHNKPFLWRNTVEDAPTQKESVGYYLTNPQKRAKALTERSAEDFTRAVDNGASKKRAERHLEINNALKNAKGGILKASDGLELNPAVVVAERPKNPSTRFYSLTTKPSLPALSERKLYLEPKSSDFAEYKAINNKEPDEVKNAREYISKLVDSEDYKKLSLTNPEIARTILSTQIESVLANTKDENVRNQISKELESFRQTSLFKKGGVLKAKGGLSDIEEPTSPDKITIPELPKLDDVVLEEPEIIDFPSPFKELDNDYHVDLMGTKRQAMRHAKKFAKDRLGFDSFWWEGKKYGLNGKPYGWGQNPSEPLKPWVVPTAVDALMSSARLGFDRKTNEIITAQKAKGIREAADASMLSKQEFIPQRMQLTAGDASKAAANRMFQHLPPVNSDYISYAAQQRAGFDAANAMLAQSDREYSTQYSENLDKNIARQQMIADRNMQIEAQNGQIQAQKMAALSELYASRDAANRQSIANYGIEQQTKYEQGMQKAREARLAREKSKWAIDAQKMYVNDLTKDIDVKSAYDAYLATNPTTPLSIENWVAGEPQFRNKVNEYMQKATQWIADQQLETELQYLPPIYKSGGKMRSASDQIATNREKANDQIKVNKYKSFDKNWEDQNKAVRKAIGKMHDRVYNILMKILS